MSRFFTKSLHKKALECPTKLYYQAKPGEYDNNSLDDPFLKALAKGGFQVGELAKIYMPGGVEVTALRSADAVPETLDLMNRGDVTIYEPAIRFGEFLVRVDILVKSGDDVRLYEVKAKSFDPDEDSFYNKTLLKKKQYQLVEKWQPYLYDIAFQTLVCQGAFPHLRFHPYLMLIDKTKMTTVEGLNQRIVLQKSQDRARVKVVPGTYLKSVGEKILITIDISDDVKRVLDGTDQGAKSRQQLGMPSFLDEASGWAKSYLQGSKLEPILGTVCKKCEFNTHGERRAGSRNAGKANSKKILPTVDS